MTSLKSKESLNNWIYLNKKNSSQSLKLPYEVNASYFECKPDSCPLYEKFIPKAKTQLSALPTVENIPEVITSDYYVIFLSGDGGWATIDKEISRHLTDAGIPVIGINSLKYFWRKKTPDRLANDFGNLINSYNNKLQKSKVILLGFSLGANMIPFINSRISKDNTSVAYSALLSPTKKTEFEVNFTDWIPGAVSESGLSLLEEIKKNQNMPLLCLAGEDDPDSVCHENLPNNVTVKKLKGTHHFDEDYEAVSKILLEEFTKSEN
jgi:type IV secretory pathway VirJ component